MFVFLRLLSMAEPITVIKSHFVINPVCNIQERIDSGCATFTSVLKSSMECVFICNQDDMCVGSSFSRHKECVIHKLCSSTISCDQDDGSYINFIRSEKMPFCFHDNKWHFEDGKCKCRNGWVGEHCEKLAESCNELAQNEYPLGDHRVTLDVMKDGSINLNLTCAITSSVNGFIVVLKHKGLGDLNKTWEEYVSGFDDGDTVTWIGLENLYLANQAGHDRLHILLTMANVSDTKIRRIFFDFQITDSSRKYEFTYGSAIESGSALEDCLEAERNVPFSTWDSDNDNVTPDNCASKHGAGWWYPTCNLNCNLVAYKTGEALQNINRATMTSHFQTLQILIREVK